MVTEWVTGNLFLTDIEITIGSAWTVVISMKTHKAAMMTMMVTIKE